jgi:CheY-like chemotaxis protein
VTDVMMPLMTGPELAGCVRRRWASIRVLYISGYSAEGSMPESVADAGMKYLAKPFTRAELLSKVREALDGAPEA